jgi:peptidoglycan/xylan/chitin deacetylase (PgdA/CDA1 family)
MSVIEDFIGRLVAVEGAWAQLDRIEAARDVAGAVAAIGAMPIPALGSAQLLVRAVDLLVSWGHDSEARNLRAAGPDPKAPAAPLLLAGARQMREVGDLEGARAAYRATMLRARPDAALLFEYAALEQQMGDPAAASAIAEAAMALRVWNDPDLIAAGRALRAMGRADLALRPFVLAFRRGYREPAFLNELHALRQADEALLAGPFVETIAGGPTLAEAIAAFAAHATLAQAQDRRALAAVARDREASPVYLQTRELHDALRDAIVARKPLSLIRLGDGEGRFLLGRRADLREPLQPDEAQAIARLMWSVWFGSDVGGAEARLDEILSAFEAAATGADLLGLPQGERLAIDDANFGYLSVVERFVAGLPADGDRRIVDAFCNIELARADPFLADLLGGLDFLGVIGPHPDLAARLQAQLGIGEVASHNIPGEGRLGRPREAGDRGRHFPETYDRLMAELTVPRPGAVFLVAGGLLGKIYCARIRELGGIALDIGAVADAWMGFNTRGAPLADVVSLDSAR